ncbi:MAG: hypothetical protein F6K14_10575 [Symploca sp. SIO2C1]|nr:hypothetical protein [Symploca sp. SIO2C1]
MLLVELTNRLQNQYNQVQIQIEELQEQQRFLQAQLQRVGSVESKMESAAALVQEAIAEIRDVCPEELLDYQATINGLFGDEAIAYLPQQQDDLDEYLEQLEDYLLSQSGQMITKLAVQFDIDGAYDRKSMDLVSEIKNYLLNLYSPVQALDFLAGVIGRLIGENSNGNSNGHSHKADIEQMDVIAQVEAEEDDVTNFGLSVEHYNYLESLKWQDLLNVAARHGINPKGLKKDALLEQLDMKMTDDEVEALINL